MLTQISHFWFDRFENDIPNHRIKDGLPEDLAHLPAQHGGEKAKPLAIECIVRGYITGSGWKEYLKQGTVCDIPLPEGLLELQSWRNRCSHRAPRLTKAMTKIFRSKKPWISWDRKPPRKCAT